MCVASVCVCVCVCVRVCVCVCVCVSVCHGCLAFKQPANFITGTDVKYTAILKYRLQVKLAVSSSSSVLKPDQPVLAFSQKRRASGRLTTRTSRSMLRV